ncbi:hypothetical protein [Actinoallomurus sp. NPDC052274]|uniref:hypothetical protein n=1 Tax=Actinoallomurus sp. NPDC052274 TaxID=3155420 RepID=UPI003449E7FA
MTAEAIRPGVPEDAHTVADRLARACRVEGLSADVLGPTRVRACVPKTHAGLAEIIKIMPDEGEVLSFYWSWGERICPASDIAGAVAAIKHVVTPPLHSAF